MNQTAARRGGFIGGGLAVIIGIAATQAIAAAYFLIDGIDDIIDQAQGGFSFEVLMDCVVALALIAGFVVATTYARTMRAELSQRDRALAVARGALAEQMTVRFAEWGLSAGEAEVALFAMKGLNVAEIAALRSAAAGTVRSQLSQIYAKAGVNSQSMLVSLFIEDLLDVPAPPVAVQ